MLRRSCPGLLGGQRLHQKRVGSLLWLSLLCVSAMMFTLMQLRLNLNGAALPLRMMDSHDVPSRDHSFTKNIALRRRMPLLHAELFLSSCMSCS